MNAKLTAAQCAVVLVNYNNAADTLSCLESLHRLRHAPACIAVVDNGSAETDIAHLREGWIALAARLGLPAPEEGDARWVPATLPRSVFLVLRENKGFSGGNNAALRLLLACSSRSRCAAFWLLNNDTEPQPDSLDALCARLAPGAGICGSTLLYADRPDTVQAAGGCTLSAWTGATGFLFGGRPLDEVRQADIADTERRMDFVVGASALVRRDLFDAIGLLPEEYFLYYEDAALGVLARRAGYPLAWARESLVLHKEGGSTGASSGHGAKAVPQRSRLVDYLAIRNRYYLMRRYFPLRLPVTLLFLGGVLLKRLGRGQADRIPLLLRAAWHGLRFRMGRPQSPL